MISHPVVVEGNIGINGGSLSSGRGRGPVDRSLADNDLTGGLHLSQHVFP